MKNLLAAITSTIALGALATDYTWTDGGTYTLGAGDTLVISGDGQSATTYTMSSGAISSDADGNGTVLISNCTLGLAYKVGTENPFAGFSGTIVFGEGAYVNCRNTYDGYEDEPPFTKYPTLQFQGGTLFGFKQGNNLKSFNNIVIPDGKTGLIQNHEANYLKGVNLSLTGPLSGGGDLTIEGDERWAKLSGDNSNFTGTFKYVKVQPTHMGGGPYFSFTAANAGSASAKWEFEMQNKCPVKFSHASSSTLNLGAFATTGATEVNIENSSATVEIGARAGTDSKIDAPFTGKAFALTKVGSDTALKLGSKVAFIQGTTLNVNAGTLEADGANFANATISSGSFSTFKVTANGTTIAANASFGTIELAEGAIITLAAPSSAAGTYTLFTYNEKADGTTFDSSTVNVTGLSLSGNGSASIVDDENGTVSLVIDDPTLVWGGSGTWSDANAWRDSVDSTKAYTFATGDNVQIVGGADSASAVTVTLDGEYTVGSLTVSGFVTLTGSGKVSVAGAFSGSDTLTVDSSAELAFANTITIKKGILFAGEGKIVFDGATATLDYSLKKTESVPFGGFAGTLVLTNNAAVTQTGRNYGYPGDNDNDLDGPFGDIAKLVFAGGTLTGFSNANNIFIHNDIEVVEGTTNTIDPIHAAGDSDSPNVNIYGKWTGKGWLNIGFKWFSNASRRFYFKSGCDLTEFEGTINCTQGGVLQIETASASSESTTWIMGNMDRMQFQGLPGNSIVKLGKLDYSRGNATGVCNYQIDGLTLEIGGKNEDSTINSPFAWKEINLVKKGSGALTLGSGATMYSGASVTVDSGMLIVNTSAEFSAPIAVSANATLSGSATMSSVSFADGARIAFDGFPETPEAGATVDGIVAESWSGTMPAIANAPVSGKGSWRVRTKSVDAGTQFYAEFVKKGFVIVIK